jgi:hypothetical protein
MVDDVCNTAEVEEEVHEECEILFDHAPHDETQEKFDRLIVETTFLNESLEQLSLVIRKLMERFETNGEEEVMEGEDNEDGFKECGTLSVKAEYALHDPPKVEKEVCLKNLFSNVSGDKGCPIDLKEETLAFLSRQLSGTGSKRSPVIAMPSSGPSVPPTSGWKWMTILPKPPTTTASISTPTCLLDAQCT